MNGRQVDDWYAVALSAENLFAFGVSNLVRLALRSERRYLEVGAEVLAAVAADTLAVGDVEREFRARLRSRGS